MVLVEFPTDEEGLGPAFYVNPERIRVVSLQARSLGDGACWVDMDGFDAPVRVTLSVEAVRERLGAVDPTAETVLRNLYWGAVQFNGDLHERIRKLEREREGLRDEAKPGREMAGESAKHAGEGG